VADPLTTSDAVQAALLRPLTSNEAAYIDSLIDQVSGLLRQAAPSIDARIARYAADSTDKTAVDPAVVETVLAGALKRYIVNPNGIANTSESVGPYSRSTSFATRYEKGTRGVLEITQDDLSALFPNRKRLRAGTIRTRPALAPRPVGRYGPIPTPAQALDAAITYSREPVLDAAPLLPIDGAL
jgi:hypothetical protein